MRIKFLIALLLTLEVQMAGDLWFSVAHKIVKCGARIFFVSQSRDLSRKWYYASVSGSEVQINECVIPMLDREKNFM